MGFGHTHQLHVERDTWLHRAPAQHKIGGLVAFIVIVVATPGSWFLLFALYAAIVVSLVVVSTVGPGTIVRRMAVEIPFVIFAALMPFIARGPTVEVLGLTLSQSGLMAAWTLLAKATIGVALGILLAATTSAPELLSGLERLRLPALMVQIVGFMIRYLEVITAELSRQQIALASRGFVARDPRHWPVLARSAGALFIRSFERGERVHQAMVSRGYTGKMP